MLTNERGDTIIEVMFAFTIFSLLAVGGLSLMNQGAAMAQRALEIGLVRQQMDAQADALRYLNKAYVADFGKRGAATAMWNLVATDNAVDKAADFDTTTNGSQCVLPTASDKPFALDLNNIDPAKMASNPKLNPLLSPSADPETYAQIRYDADGISNPKAEGIWVQAVRSQNVTSSDGTVRPGFYDFHIRACWLTPGQTAPITLGTIVRLYEPR